jgi:hypothetical protein
VRNFMKTYEMNGYLGLGMIIMVVAFAWNDRIDDIVLGIAIALGAGLGMVGVIQAIRGTVAKTNQINSNLYRAKRPSGIVTLAQNG